MLSTSQIISLIAGALTMMVQGSLYTFGTITPYIASFLYYQGQKDVTINQLQIIVTVSILCINSGMLLPKINKLKFSNFMTSIISIVGISLSVFIISFSQNFAMFFIFYGMVFGFFIGFGYVAPVKNCYQHIPDKKGLCTGVCIMGFGIGALFFNMVLLHIINPNNQKVNQNHHFPQNIANNLPFALRIMSAIYLGLGSVGSILIRPVKKLPNQQKINPLLIEQQDDKILQTSQTKKTIGSKWQQLKDKYYFVVEKKIYLLVLTLAFSVPYGNFVAFYYKQYGLTKINNDQMLTIIGSAGSIVNGLSRLFWGYLMDKVSYKTIATSMNVVLLICCGCIFFAVENQYLYLIVVLFTYSCYGGSFGIYPTQTVRILGKKKGSQNYWITFSGFSIAAIIQFVSHYFLVHLIGQNGFKYCFMIFAAFLIAAICIVRIYTFDYDQEQKKFVKPRDLKGKYNKKQQNVQSQQKIQKMSLRSSSQIVAG